MNSAYFSVKCFHDCGVKNTLSTIIRRLDLGKVDDGYKCTIEYDSISTTNNNQFVRHYEDLANNLMINYLEQFGQLFLSFSLYGSDFNREYILNGTTEISFEYSHVIRDVEFTYTDEESLKYLQHIIIYVKRPECLDRIKIKIIRTD